MYYDFYMYINRGCSWKNAVEGRPSYVHITDLCIKKARDLPSIIYTLKVSCRYAALTPRLSWIDTWQRLDNKQI
jgi:hypothetical protein